MKVMLPRFTRLTAQRLMRRTWRHRHRRLFVATRALAALGVAAVLVLLWREHGLIPPLARWLRRHVPALAFALGVIAAFSCARHRAELRRLFTKSWLAALPRRKTIGCAEAFVLETVPAQWALACVSALFFAALLVSTLTSAGQALPLLESWAALSAAMILGALASYAIPAAKPLDLPPGSRYVPHQRMAARRKLRPSLNALALWPIRQMFASAHPKLVARATAPVLLAMGMGSTADTALLALALAAVCGGIVLLLSALWSLRTAIARWTAPLPVARARVRRRYLAPAIALICAAAAIAALLSAALRK